MLTETSQIHQQIATILPTLDSASSLHSNQSESYHSIYSNQAEYYHSIHSNQSTESIDAAQASTVSIVSTSTRSNTPFVPYDVRPIIVDESDVSLPEILDNNNEGSTNNPKRHLRQTKIEEFFHPATDWNSYWYQ